MDIESETLRKAPTPPEVNHLVNTGFEVIYIYIPRGFKFLQTLVSANPNTSS